MDWSDDLTGVHYDIAASSNSQIAVLAGPGTGKTSFGIMRRVARLLQEGEDPESILLVSFTRTAAADLKSKLVDNLVQGGIASAEKITASTLHSLAYKMLLEEGLLEGLGRNGRILLNHEEKLMLHDLKLSGRNYRECDRMLRELEAGWLTEVGKYPGPVPNSNTADFERDVQEWLISRESMLIGEVMPIVNKFLRINPYNDYTERYRHVIVDEFQDLNPLEQDTINQLVGPAGNLMVVGDDDQSIYGWRLANPQGIIDFANDPRTQAYTIAVCGRSPQNIVAVANEIKSHMPGSAKGKMVSLSQEDGYVANVQWKSIEDEIAGTVKAVVHRVSNGVKPGNILVLVQRTSIGKEIRDRLNLVGVEAHTYFPQDPLDTRRARRGLALLRLVDQTDLPSWRVLLGLKPDSTEPESDGDGYTTGIKKLDEMSAEYNQSWLEVLERLAAGEGLKYPASSLSAVMRNYAEGREALSEMESLSVEQIVDYLFPPEDPRTHDIRELCLQGIANGVSDVQELVGEVVSRITQLGVPEEASHIRIMTLHKSKGLTSELVFVTSLVNGVIPNMAADMSAQERRQREAEGRRLFYVAVTRASKELVVSSFRSAPANVAVRLKIPGGREGGTHTTVQASQYFLELTGTLGAPIRGDDWLPTYLERFASKEAAADD